MYTGKYTPNFPYTGDQATISSGRILFHAKDDSYFVFAKEAISFSTSGSVHVNSNNGTYINASTIELGLNAQEPVIKGNTMAADLRQLYTSLSTFVAAVGGISESELEVSVVDITEAATSMLRTIQKLKSNLPNTLSQITKTV